MQIVRYPSWAEARMRIIGSACLGLLTLSLLAFLYMGAVATAPEWVVITGTLSLILACKLTFRVVALAQGIAGEQRLERTLSVLDDRYVIIRNFVPERRHGDIDFVLIGPFGSLIIEAKNYSAPVKCKGDLWQCRLHNGRWRRIKSLSKQLKGNVLSAKSPFPAPHYGVLVFNDNAELQLNNATVTILGTHETLPFVKALPDAGIQAGRDVFNRCA